MSIDMHSKNELIHSKMLEIVNMESPRIKCRCGSSMAVNTSMTYGGWPNQFKAVCDECGVSRYIATSTAPLNPDKSNFCFKTSTFEEALASYEF